MKYWVTILGLAGSAFAGIKISPVGEYAHEEALIKRAVQAKTCPSLSPAAWQRFLERSTFEPEEPQNAVAIAQTLEYCGAKIGPGKPLACLQNLLSFVSNAKLGADPKHILGFSLSDAEYFKTRPKEAVGLPPELQNEIPANIEEIAKKKGWETVKFKSRAVTNPPNNSKWRLLIRIPGDRYDRWLNITTPSDGGPWKPTETMIDVVGVDKTTEPKTLHYYQYWREQGEFRPIIQRSTWNKEGQAHGTEGRCFSCHLGMPRIRPEPGSVSDETQAKVDSFNAVIEGYAGGKPATWYRHDAAPVMPAGAPLLGASQSCTGCHDRSQQPGIDPLTKPDFVETHLGVYHMMPPGSLTTKLQNALRLTSRLPAEARKKIADTGNTHQDKEAVALLHQHGLLPEPDHTELATYLNELDDALKPRQTFLTERSAAIEKWLKETPCNPL